MEAGYFSVSFSSLVPVMAYFSDSDVTRIDIEPMSIRRRFRDFYTMCSDIHTIGLL